jgi:probable rRNA maturation factor
MILLDPDLDPYPAAKKLSTARSSAGPKAGKSLTPSSQFDLPTARTLARFLGRAQEAVGLKGQVTVLLTTDAAIRGMNRKFRNMNKATDVLSFPAEGVGARGTAGDLAISVTTALRQAREQGHPLWMEIKVLILHGLLHLAGYDHETDKGRMARRERALRAELRLPQGLIERVEAHPGIKMPAKAKKP